MGSIMVRESNKEGKIKNDNDQKAGSNSWTDSFLCVSDFTGSVCSNSNSNRFDTTEIYRSSDRNSSFVAYNITFAGKKIPKENIVLDGCYTDDNQYCS